MKRFLVIAIMLTLALFAQADRVKVRLFSNVKLGALSVSFDLGSYNLYADGNLYYFMNPETYEQEPVDGSVLYSSRLKGDDWWSA